MKKQEDIIKTDEKHAQDNQKVRQVTKNYPRPPEVFDKECIIQEKCTAEQIPYLVKSGKGMESFPIICLNGKVIFSKNLKDSKIGRGINMVVLDRMYIFIFKMNIKKSKIIGSIFLIQKINYCFNFLFKKEETLNIKSAESYDSFTDDSLFYRYVKTTLSDGDIVMIASYDEMANALRETTSQFMQNYGSQLFSNIKFRDSFVMIGQRGISKGKAIEIHEPKKSGDFAPAAVISGCVTFPLGIIHPVKLVEMQVNGIDKISVKEVVENCGLRDPCKQDEFAVHIYSGLNIDDEPKICVDGRYVIGRNINDAGRGINIVIIANGKEIIKTAHFDTYAEDSTNLEIFLESLSENTIIIAVTFDEASAK